VCSPTPVANTSALTGRNKLGARIVASLALYGYLMLFNLSMYCYTPQFVEGSLHVNVVVNAPITGLL
jgi:hypothetical protein